MNVRNTDKTPAIIFSRQASLARQAFLITPLHGARYKTGKNAYAKNVCSELKSVITKGLL